MANGINKVILVGNLGKDPEVRYAASGSAIANITIATGESWKDKQTGEKQERTEWHRVVMFNRLGEIAGEYLHKGSKVYIEGRLQTRKWTDQSGMDRYTTEIVANDMQMLDSRGAGGSTNYNQGAQAGGAPMGGQQGGGQAQNNQYNQSNNPAQGGQQAAGGGAAPANNNFDNFDDDVPF